MGDDETLGMPSAEETVLDGDETRIPLVEEELVVQKRLVVRECS